MIRMVTSHEIINEGHCDRAQVTVRPYVSQTLAKPIV